MDIKQLFENAGQGQVFRFWDELSEIERGELSLQASEIDLLELENLVATLVRGDSEGDAIDFSTLQPSPYTRIPESIDTDTSWQEALRAGELALKSGHRGISMCASMSGNCTIALPSVRAGAHAPVPGPCS